MALIGTGFAIAAVLRMRTEETAGRLEPLLATALARPRWAAGYVAVAALGTVVVLAASGLGAGIADAAEQRRPRPGAAAGRLVGRAGARRVGADRRRRRAVRTAAATVAAAWGALAACYLAAFLGPLLGLPDWVMDISPFTHVPLLPAAEFDVVPLARR